MGGLEKVDPVIVPAARRAATRHAMERRLATTKRRTRQITSTG
jgi:hypothetical protein